MKLKDKHLLILRHLRHDARSGFSVMSRKTGIPVTTIFDTYNKLLENGVIKKHVCIVDFKKMGYGYRSFVLVKSKKKESLITFLLGNPCINSIFRVDRYDFMIDCVFPGIKEHYAFLEELNQFDTIGLESHDVIENIKSEEFSINQLQPEKHDRL